MAMGCSGGSSHVSIPSKLHFLWCGFDLNTTKLSNTEGSHLAELIWTMWCTRRSHITAPSGEGDGMGLVLLQMVAASPC